jgi:glutamate racemase
MALAKEQPIGIFDSGVGGLTVAQAIKQLLPDEVLIYFGDTAHLPYGDKSTESILNYSKKISELLLEKNCKVILVACNTASAVAFGSLKNYLGEKIILLNVIEPVIDYIHQKKTYRKIGVIGTKATINSGTYEKKLKEKDRDIEVKSLATPLLVPMIEEGFIYDDISNAIIRVYLSKRELDGIQALILGCTHYPIIRNQISKFYNFDVEVLDSAQIVANELKKMLISNDLLNPKDKKDYRFFVSDYTPFFEKISRKFFGETIHLEKIDLWK